MVIDEGKVVGFETHDYLLKNCHIYNELYTADLKIANREQEYSGIVLSL